MPYDHATINDAISALTGIFEILEDSVPKPTEVIVNDHPALRYEDKSLHQALVLKLARYISGLNAAHLLLTGHYLQEQGVLQRTLDDIGDDIAFLAIQNSKGPNKLCRKFLDVFWQEEFEEGVKPIDNSKARYQISRPEIRKSISSAFSNPSDELSTKAGSVLSQTYSGYVHAAAPHIMEMYDYVDSRFSLAGSKDSRLNSDHADDFWNYIYRGFLSAQFVAAALGNEKAVRLLEDARERFEANSGTSIMSEVRHDLRTNTENRG